MKWNLHPLDYIKADVCPSDTKQSTTLCSTGVRYLLQSRTKNVLWTNISDESQVYCDRFDCSQDSSDARLGEGVDNHTAGASEERCTQTMFKGQYARR